MDEAFGGTRTGACITDGSALVCGRVQEPPKAAIAACDKLAAGDACTLPDRFGKAPLTGVCSLGPAGTGSLACTPAQEIVTPWEKACEGLAAGTSCSLGRGPFATRGTCVAPTAGGANVCVLPCANLGGSFDCGHKGESDAGRETPPGVSDAGPRDFPGEGSDPGHGTCPGHKDDDAGSPPVQDDAGAMHDGGARPL